MSKKTKVQEMDAEAVLGALKDKEKLSVEDVRFRFDGKEALMEHSTAGDAAMVYARTKAGDVTRAIEAYLKGAVEDHLKNIDVDTMIELHAEPAIERAIQTALDKGWQSGKDTRSLAKVVDQQIRSMAAGKIADEYRVEVQVRLVKG